MNTKQEVIGALASVIGRNVGTFLDTTSPRLVTYRVTSKPVVYKYTVNGDALHDSPVTESFQFSVTLHPDGSVEGVTTLDKHLATAKLWQVHVDYESLKASCYFSGIDERTTAVMHYETGLSYQAARVRTFEHIDDPQQRATYAAAKTEQLQAMLAASQVCTMMFEHNDEYGSERAQVTILKAPFRIDVSRWSRSAHFFPDDERRDQRDCEAAGVNFKVATIELVQGVAVDMPVFS
jgi:hypothetical protein